MAALVQDRARDTAKGRAQGRRGERVRSGHAPHLRLVTEGEKAGGRRQAVLVALVVLTLLALGGSLADAVARIGTTDGSPATAEPVTVTAAAAGAVHVVQAGETYWSLAEEFGGRGDIRAVVAALQEGNGGRVLRAGDRLVIPALE